MTQAFNDIGAALKRLNLWARLAATDMQQTYTRSIFGIAWIALAFGLFVYVKILIFGSFAPGEPGEFIMWLTFGLWMFFFLQQCVVDGTTIFVNSRSWLLSTDLPLSGFVMQSLIRGLIKVMYQIPVVIIAVLYSGWDIPIQAVWAIPAFLVVLFNALWVQLAFGIICARFRDVAHLVQSVMVITFFITPILYFPSQVGDRAVLLNYNPLTHYIAIIRDPIIYGTHPELSWIVVGSLTLGGWIFTLALLQALGKRVVFWV